MFKTIGVETFDQLIYETIPENIRLKNDLQLEPAMTEYEYSQHIHELGKKNKIFKSYIGLGYHPTIVPAVIQRNVFENPGWYSAYTPYQAEIAQGRLEAILNFQTTVIELTGMEIANASLLDESTAAAEAMALLFDVRSRDQKKNNTNKFFVSEEILPQTLSVLQTRSNPIGVELVIGNHETFDFSTEFFGAILQYPGKFGQVNDYGAFIAKAKEQEIKVAVAADILSLVKAFRIAEYLVKNFFNREVRAFSILDSFTDLLARERSNWISTIVLNFDSAKSFNIFVVLTVCLSNCFNSSS
jgi:glycine dehydrogenase